MTLKDHILTTISQVYIFSRYLDISESDIQECITYKMKVKSPFRDDPVPSMSFKYYGNKLICRDFGDIYYSGDVFEIVGKIIGKDWKDSNEFIDICKDIIDSTSIKKPDKIVSKADSIESPTKIEIIDRHFVNKDFKYFNSFFINRNIVKKAYIPVKTYFINDFRSNYYYSTSDPCYAYVNNPGSYKLYFPFRLKSQKRFISNNKVPIELITSIRVTDYTILIKAYKDKLLMDYVCTLLGITNIQFIPVSSESARLPQDIIDFLRRFTRKKIFTMFDIDRCGVESSILYREEYGFGNIFLGEDYTTKDPTDLINSIKLGNFLKKFDNIYKTF